MNFVEPIREKGKVKEIYEHLKNSNKENAERDAFLFLFSVYVGLRISDVRLFKVSDCMKNGYDIIEKKTGKRKFFEWNPYLKRAIKDYIKDKDPDEYLFKSRKGKNKPITRERAYVIIRQACNDCGVYHVGAHTPRKTFGYFLYKQNKANLAKLMDIFNHTSEKTTLAYIGVTQEINNKLIKGLKYF